MDWLHTKKFRHGSVSLALTVVIIAAVILVNAIFTALAQKFLWYVDMTAEQIYSLSDGAKALLDKVDPEKEVKFIFCSEKDVLEANTSQRYVLHTILDMQKEYDNIKVEYVDYITHPSAVSKYKEFTQSNTLDSKSIIVTSGTEARVYSLDALYSYNSAGDEIIGYNGEQRLVSAVLAVTQAESPVCTVIQGHGENEGLAETNNAILTLLYETGYQIEFVDLLKGDPISPDSRLMLIYDPIEDFVGKSAMSEISELDIIDDYLDKNNALMVFLDYETKPLPVLETYLEEWGIAVQRMGNANYLIRDVKNSLTPTGFTNVSSFVEDNGVGGSIVKGLRDQKYPKKVLFPYTTSLTLSSTYERLYDEGMGGWCGIYNANGVNRVCYDVFLSSGDAVAEVGNIPESDDAPFSYMKVTQQVRTDDNGNSSHAYVLVCGSTQFASVGALDTSYGNHQVLTYACSVMGRAVIPVSLDCKYFADLEINSITSSAATQYTVVLTVVPASVVFIAGIYVMVRRKYA